MGCARGGSVVCTPCLLSLPDTAWVAWPSPTPPGLVAPYAVTEYAGLPREMILGHKERGLLGLGRPLGHVLAVAVATAIGEGARSRATSSATLVLIPVPSRRASVRSRGHDPMLSVTRHAAGILTASGWPARCAPLLRPGPGLADQSGLDAQQRAQNVRGSMRVGPGPVRRLARSLSRSGGPTTVICDDVLTTGATAREAQRAAEVAGIEVSAIATIAATRRRVRASGHQRSEAETSGDSLSRNAARH